MKKCSLYFKAIFTVKMLTVTVAFLLTSCYSGYLSINYEVHSGAVWNDKHTNVAFVASKTAWRSVKDVARFPVGGRSLYLLEDVGLYIFDYENKLLDELISFNELAGCIGTNRTRWEVKLVLTDTMVYYSVSPLLGWDREIEHPLIPEKSQLLASLKEKYKLPYAFNMFTKTETIIDSTVFNNLFAESKDAYSCNLTSLNKQLAKIPLADWGLNPQVIYPKPDRKYIEETIYLRNTSSQTRRAVIEQIIARLSKSEIELLLKKMDDYKNSLEGLKKTEFELYSKDSYEQIKALL